MNDQDGTTASLAAISQRLFHEFGAQTGLPEIVAVVRRCRSELDVVPLASIPELVERLARERLRIAATKPTAVMSAGPVW